MPGNGLRPGRFSRKRRLPRMNGRDGGQNLNSRAPALPGIIKPYPPPHSSHICPVVACPSSRPSPRPPAIASSAGRLLPCLRDVQHLQFRPNPPASEHRHPRPALDHSIASANTDYTRPDRDRFCNLFTHSARPQSSSTCARHLSLPTRHRPRCRQTMSTSRQSPVIIITGTPGTGKTTHAQLLVQESPVPLKHINVGEMVKEKGFYEEFDEEWQSYTVDEDKVRPSRPPCSHERRVRSIQFV